MLFRSLADLIRPALSQKPEMPGEPAAGAFPGGGFTVTGAMTSLVGCSGDDFAAILTSLGYRMEMKPTPAPKPVAAIPAPEASAEAVVPDDSAANVDTGASEEPLVSPDEPAVETSTEIASIPEALEYAAISVTPDAEDILQAPDLPATTPETAPEADVAEPSQVEGNAEPAEAAPSAPVVEPVLVAVWRPGRPEHDRNRYRGQQQGRSQENRALNDKVQPGGEREKRVFTPRPPRPPASAVAAVNAEGQPLEQQGSGSGPREVRRGPPRDFSRNDQQEKRSFGDKSKPGDPRAQGGKRPQGGSRPFGEGRGQEGRGKDGQRPDRNAIFASSAPPQRAIRDKPIDPDSPFAKLLELKAKLEGKS